MGLKKFYAYTWGKVLTSIILVLSSITYIFVIAGANDATLGPIQFGIMAFFFWPFFLLRRIEGLFLSSVNWLGWEDLPFIIVAFIINAWWFYTIACVIGWLVGRFDK